jgi:hypothetical protein
MERRMDVEKLKMAIKNAKPELPWTRCEFWYDGPLVGIEELDQIDNDVFTNEWTDFVILACNALPELLEEIERLKKKSAFDLETINIQSETIGKYETTIEDMDKEIGRLKSKNHYLTRKLSRAEHKIRYQKNYGKWVY